MPGVLSDGISGEKQNPEFLLFNDYGVIMMVHPSFYKVSILNICLYRRKRSL